MLALTPLANALTRIGARSSAYDQRRRYTNTRAVLLYLRSFKEKT